MRLVSPKGDLAQFFSLGDLTDHPETQQWMLYIDPNGARKYLTGEEYQSTLQTLVDLDFLPVS